MPLRPAKAIPSLTILAAVFSLTLCLGACGSSPDPSPPSANGDPEPAPPENGGQDAGAAGDLGMAGLSVAGSGFGMIQDVLIFFGADRRPSYALREIAAVHDMKSWTHRPGVSDAVDRCREAVQDLTISDYDGWNDKALVIAVLSTMSVRDSSGLVRHDCIDALAWFEGKVRPEVLTLGRGVDTTEEEVIRALRALDELNKDPGPELSLSEKMVCIDAISILGSHPWDAVRGAAPSTVRTSLSRPRGVIRRLTARDLDAYRADAEVKATFDQALVRVAGEVLFMSQIAGLADPVEHVRAAAAKALKLSEDRRAVKHLAYALKTEEMLPVRLAIISSLRELVMRYPEMRRASIPALAAALTGTDESVRRASARALAGILEKGPADDPAWWQRWWSDHGEEYQTK